MNQVPTCLYQDFGNNTFAFKVIVLEPKLSSMTNNKPLQHLFKPCNVYKALTNVKPVAIT